MVDYNLSFLISNLAVMYHDVVFCSNSMSKISLQLLQYADRFSIVVKTMALAKLFLDHL